MSGEEKQVDEAGRHVSEVVYAPSIPMPGTNLNLWWIIPWSVALFICVISVPVARPYIYYKQWMDLPDTPVDLELDIAGCDIDFKTTDEVSGSSIRLTYWKTHGTGNISQINATFFRVYAKTDRKLSSYPCKLQVLTPPGKLRVFDNLKIQISKDQFTKFNPGPSNVAEVVALSLEDFRVEHSFELLVSTSTETVLSGVQVGENGLLKADMKGGKLEILEASLQGDFDDAAEPAWYDEKYAKEPFLPRSMDLKLKAATVVIASRNNNIKAHIAQDTVDDAILAAARIDKPIFSGSLVSYYMYKGSDGNDIDVTLSADNCAIYFSAYNKEYFLGNHETHPLQKESGSSTTEVSLLPDGEVALHNLADWLQNGTHASKFVVYIQLTAPSVPPGTFRLLSTSSYMALSMATFSLISGGMLTPDIVRIITPVKGFSWLFPRRKADGPISDENLKTFSFDSFMCLTKYIDTFTLGLPKAAWIWDPPGPEFDIFEYIPKKYKWRQRPVGSQETFDFKVASAITLGLGLFVGAIAVAAIYYLLVPHVKKQLRDLFIVNAGTYNLSNQIPATDWKVPAAMVRYPIPGVMLRWAIRDSQAMFSTFSIRARKWPIDPKDNMVVVSKISPDRVPTLPANPGQQVFLFGTHPPKKAPPQTPTFKDLFDMELYACAMLCCGTSGLPLRAGSRFQFRVDAYGQGANPKVIEKSEWSRPVHVTGSTVFTDIPFILWKVICGVLPQDTFQYFLTKHCLPIANAPCLQIHLCNMKLCLVNDSALFMGKGGAYGQDIDNAGLAGSYANAGVLTDQQFVEIQASTGSSTEELTMMNTMFEKTNDFLLPGMNSDKRKNLSTLSEIMEGKKQSARTHGMDYSKFLVLDIDKIQKPRQESLTLNVGLDLTQTLRIETVLIEYEKGQDRNSAKFEDTWKAFIQSIIAAERCESSQLFNARLIDEVVMRDGLTPAAMLIADCELMNSAINGSLKKKTNVAKLPDIFSHVIPGMSFIWGETLLLSWTKKVGATYPTEEFDILLVSENLSHLHDNKVEEEHQRTITVLAMEVPLSAEKVTVALAPKQPYSVVCMRCHFEIRFHIEDTKEHLKVMASSDEFVILRPVTQQDLELGYAAFCARNEIPMDRIEKSKLTPFYQIEILEKSVNICTGYRQPLPIVGTGEPEQDLCKIVPKEGQPLVKNPDSYVIVDPHGLVVPAEIDLAAEAKQKKSAKKTGSKEEAAVVSSKAIPARTELIDLITNVYWRKNTDWSEETLLVNKLVPFFADMGFIETQFEYYNFAHFASAANFLDHFLRGFLKMLLYLWQFVFLFFPGFLAMYACMQVHFVDSELNPGTRIDEGLKSVVLGQVVSPSVFTFNSLSYWDKVVYWFFVLYFVLMVAATFYGNFIHNKFFVLPVYFFLNTSVGLIASVSFYLVVVYVCVVLVWILMGSVIDPATVMPYALLFLGSLFIAHSVWSKTSVYREQILKQMEDKLDLVTHAVMGIFVGTASPDDAPQFQDLVESVTEIMRQQEAKTVDKIYEQGNIVSDVDGCVRDQILKMRSSDEFKAMCAVTDEDGKPGVQNQFMSTDFVPENCWKLAQEKSNEMATLADKRAAPDEYGTVPDEKITAEALSYALAQQGLDGLGDPLKINRDDAVQVQKHAKKIGLRPTTATVTMQAFSLAVSQSHDPALSDPWALQTIFTSIRMDQLFKHFIYEEEPNPSGKGKGKVKSTALSFLKDLEKKDLLNLDAALAKALSKFLYWPNVSRQVARFAATSIRDSVTFAIDNQLNPVMEGTAAFKVRTKSCDCLYNNFEKVYKSNAMQFFIDVGIVEEKFSKTEECKGMINTAVGNFLNFDGSMDPSGLMKAVDWVCFPSTRKGAQGEGSGQMTMKNYFWYDALVLSLTQLGWNTEEMEPTWLQSRWLELTQNKGVFAYTYVDEINILIQVGFADGGLWKAATKAMMLNVKLGGYSACDLERDGMKAASALAHKVSLGDQTDLKFLNDNLRWPPLMQDIWYDVAIPSKGGTAGADGKKPTFLELVRIDKFLQSIIYMPDIQDKGKIQRTQLNPLAIDDLQWYKGDDGGLWDGDGGSAKRIRGIWMELLLEVFNVLECFPTDLDLFLQALQWQYKSKGTTTKWLQYHGLRWLDTDYLAGKEADSATLTANEFYLLLKDYMNCEIPADVLKEQVFSKCAWVPDDDLGELRYLKDVSAALRYWMGYGLWKGAIEQTIMYFMPRSQLRRLALQCLDAEFNKLDVGNTGILQPGQAVVLLRKLTHPGLTCPDLQKMLKEDLQLEIPIRELHKYFAMNDVSGDGVLQVSEFVCTCRYLMTNYYPQHIMRNMNLSYAIIIGIVLSAVGMLVAIFLCITLVIKSFTTSKGVGDAIHSMTSAMGVAAMKAKSDAQVGADDTLRAVRAKIDETLTSVMCATMGLSPVAATKLKKMIDDVKR